MTRLLKIVAFAAMGAASFALPSQATEAGLGSVTACSKEHSGKCKSGLVRKTTVGKQVRLPGGAWVDCAGDCQDKLRQKTVDFWYEQQARN